MLNSDDILKNDLWSKTSPDFIKFLKNFPRKDEDDILTILKGHLLIEELLIGFVSKKIKKAEELENFKFHHYLCLAKALDETCDNNWIWLAIEKLNVMRNKLAHKLQPTGLKELKEDFIKIVRTKGATLKPEEELFEESLVEEFGELNQAITLLYVALSIELHWPL